MEEKICRNCTYWGTEEEEVQKASCFNKFCTKDGEILIETEASFTCDNFRSLGDE